MDESIKKAAFLIGIIVFIYIFFKYILPVIFAILGFVINAVFWVIIWAIASLAIVVLLYYIINIIKNS